MSFGDVAEGEKSVQQIDLEFVPFIPQDVVDPESVLTTPAGQ